MNTTTLEKNIVNGLDLDALGEIVQQVSDDPANGIVWFNVNSDWQGRTKSRHQIEGLTLGGNYIPRPFTIVADEPLEFLGANSAPNPQELLMAAFNACIMVGYVAGAALRGIRLDSVQIETTGSLDLRGFLGLDENVAAGYEKISTVVRIKGDGTPEQFAEIHETVKKTSPNYFNITRPVAVDCELVVG
ncbi:MAG: OsmC family protein [Alphaproteobacteria bacterium]